MERATFSKTPPLPDRAKGSPFGGATGGQGGEIDPWRWSGRLVVPRRPVHFRASLFSTASAMARDVNL